MNEKTRLIFRYFLNSKGITGYFRRPHWVRLMIQQSLANNTGM